eukprot:scaffold5517_cov135-Cylindrotheca_fusiformis.AAC.33
MRCWDPPISSFHGDRYPFYYNPVTRSHLRVLVRLIEQLFKRLEVMTKEDPKDESKNGALSKGIRSAVSTQKPYQHGAFETGTIISGRTETYRNVVGDDQRAVGRKEFGPHIVASSGAIGGAVVSFRRGRFAGLFGAAVASVAAYGIVYDDIAFDKVPDVVFGKQERKD